LIYNERATQKPANPRRRVKDVERLFLERLAPRKTGEQSNGMQEIRTYRLTTGIQAAEQLVLVSGATPVNAEPVAIISSMMDDPKR
jgi:hypothetical protein